MKTTVTGKNQITIPAAIVKELDLHPGIQLDWSVSEDGSIVARRLLGRRELAKKLAGRGRRLLRAGSRPIRDLVAERSREDREEGLE